MYHLDLSNSKDSRIVIYEIDRLYDICIKIIKAE